MTLPRYGREPLLFWLDFVHGMTLPRYDRERYKNSLNLDILPTYTQGMSKSCIIYLGLLV